MEATKKGKRVLITGCSSGFGLLTAVEAARAGYDVVATMRNLAKADYLRQALEQAHATAVIERLDVTDGACIETIAEKYRPVDILINNAGILTMGSFLDITEEEMRNIFETNYFGIVALTRAVVPGMIQNGSGLVINIASLAGLIGHIFNAAYCASKHALVGFSKSIRQELKPFNINVVSVEPGYHKTEIIRANAKDVVATIMKIMAAGKPKAHYVIGKDAWLATTMQWLGLTGVMERKIHNKLLSATRRENRRAEARKARRKKSLPGQ